MVHKETVGGNATCITLNMVIVNQVHMCVQCPHAVYIIGLVLYTDYISVNVEKERENR